MEVNFDIYSVLLLLGSFQGVLFFLLLLVRGLRSHSLSDGLMGTLLLLLVVQIFPFMISFMGSSLIWSDLLFFPFDIGLLLGPVIYFYLKSQTNAEFRLQKRDLLHALPYVIYVAYHLSIFVQGKQYVQYWLANVHLSYNVPMIFGCAVLLSNYFYLFLAMRYYGEFRQWLEAEFSNAKELSLRWYRNFLLLALCGITLSWGFYLISSLGVNLTYTQSWWEYVFISAIIYVLSIAAYNQPQVVYLRFKPSELPKPEENKLALPAAEMEVMGAQVLQQFLDRKLYLNPKLTLSQMAADLSINSNLLSQLINTVFGKNFNQFVNDYRIEEFKKEARKPDNRHLSLLAIAMNCGFNSKATFNRVFKNASGLSPKEYLNSAP